MPEEPVTKVMQILLKTETVADNILMNKRELVNLDKRRQEAREALRNIEKLSDPKIWFTIGTMLVKMKRDKAMELLKKDQAQLEQEINKLNSNQKVLVNELRDLEHAPQLKGFNLKPLSKIEIAALRKTF